MSFYIILRGSAGSGKTTIAKELAKIYSAEHILIDKIKRNLGLKHSESEKLEANKEVVKQTRKYLDQGKIVILDEVLYYESQLLELEKIPYKNYIFSLKAPLDICLKRNRIRRAKKQRKMSDENVILVHKLVSQLKKGIKINAYGKDVDETVSEITSYLPKPE